MKTPDFKSIVLIITLAVAVSATTISPQSVWATCGGGGGGGGGGVPPPPPPPPPPPARQTQNSKPAPTGNGVATYGAASSTRRPPGSNVYIVSWQRVEKPADLRPETTLCWIPASPAEYTSSPLRTSRTLTLRSGCLNLVYADATSEIAQKYLATEKAPIVMLVAADGSIVEKTDNAGTPLVLQSVEKLVQGEMDRRLAAIDQKLQDAKTKATSGDSKGAADDFRTIFTQRCSTPEQKRAAWDELQKLGSELKSSTISGPNFDTAIGARVEQSLVSGALAENAGNYARAERYYTSARRLDPGDPVPLRYLGELYRHQMGDWTRARRMFTQILEMEPDPLTKAVALQGMGKMTIHDGEFEKGLHLIEEAANTFPLALAYRNLAVYWLSEGDIDKAWGYTKQALAIDPDDVYNQVFFATIRATTGHPEDALKVAEDNIGLMPASYNLAAIYALNGQKQKALKLLKRHFFQYERYRAVRGEEMMEARVDAVFASMRKDPDFLALTSGADGKMIMPGH